MIIGARWTSRSARMSHTSIINVRTWVFIRVDFHIKILNFLIESNKREFAIFHSKKQKILLRLLSEQLMSKVLLLR
ncbi:unnamed protein product [Rotaria socialis]